MTVLFILLGTAVIIAVVKYFSYKKQLLDRISLDPESIKLEEKISLSNELLALRFGLLFIGIALGIILGAFLNTIGLFFTYPEFGYLAGIFLCGGFALIIGHLIESSKKNNNKF